MVDTIASIGVIGFFVGIAYVMGHWNGRRYECRRWIRGGAKWPSDAPDVVN